MSPPAAQCLFRQKESVVGGGDPAAPVNDEAAVRTLAKRGITCIIGNFPDMTRRVLTEMAAAGEI